MSIGNHYEVIRGSDTQRDGMFLELWDRTTHALALEVFYSDADGTFSITRYRNDVPAEVESWFQQEARRLLPPAAD